MFEQLINDTAARFNLSAASVSALLGQLLSLITSDRAGGPEGFVDRFRRAGLGDVIASWLGGKDGRTITPSQVESALGTSVVDKLANSSGLTRAITTSALTFLLPKVIGRLSPNGALASAGALLPQVSGYIERAATSPVESRVKNVQRQWPRWLPWAAAAVLAIAALLWMRTPAGTIDPQLTVSNRDGKVTYSGVVRDARTQTAIVDALRAAFGTGNVDGSLRVDPNVKVAPWVGRLGELFAALKTPGVEFTLNGNAIGLGGWVSAADRQALNDKLRGIFGAQSTIGSLGDAAANAVRAANDKALSALGAIGTSGVSTDALVQAMNIAIINFPSGSAEIPADNMEVIRKSADAIRRAPAGFTIEIGGHTDDTGDPDANFALSRARAESVKSALVNAGAPASALTTKGYGDSRPRATNQTEYGRFQNRRIEYSVFPK